MFSYLKTRNCNKAVKIRVSLKNGAFGTTFVFPAGFEPEPFPPTNYFHNGVKIGLKCE